MNKQIQSFLRQMGIRHQTTNDYTPEQNGLAERANRTIAERARCMLFEANLPKSCWAEAAAVYLVNHSYIRGHGLIPEEVWNGWKPDISYVRDRSDQESDESSDFEGFNNEGSDLDPDECLALNSNRGKTANDGNNDLKH